MLREITQGFMTVRIRISRDAKPGAFVPGLPQRPQPLGITAASWPKYRPGVDIGKEEGSLHADYSLGFSHGNRVAVR